MNDIKKKQYLQWMVSDIGADVAMFNETKLTSACVLHDLHSHQTLDIRKMAVPPLPAPTFTGR